MEVRGIIDMLALVYGGLLGWVAAQVVVNIPGHLADEVIGRYVQSLGPDTFNQAGNGLYTQYANLKDGINAFNFRLTAFSARKGENFLDWDVEVDFSSRFDWLITTKEKLNLTGWTAISLNADFTFYALFNNEEYNCYYGSCKGYYYNLKDTQIQVFSNSSSPQITSRFQEEQESLVDFLIGIVVPEYVQQARDDLVFWGKKTPFGVGEYILDRPREKCMWGVFSVPLRIPYSDWDNYETWHHQGVILVEMSQSIGLPLQRNNLLTKNNLDITVAILMDTQPRHHLHPTHILMNMTNQCPPTQLLLMTMKTLQSIQNP